MESEVTVEVLPFTVEDAQRHDENEDESEESTPQEGVSFFLNLGFIPCIDRSGVKV